MRVSYVNERGDGGGGEGSEVEGIDGGCTRSLNGAYSRCGSTVVYYTALQYVPS